MFYVKSIDRYNRVCEHYQSHGADGNAKPDYYCQCWYDPVSDKWKIRWSNSPTPMDRERLVQALQLIDSREQIEITTGGYS